MAEQSGNGRRRFLRVEVYRALEQIARIEDDAQRAAAIARAEAIVDDAWARYTAEQLLLQGAGVPEVRP